jgi:hypothetical protein
MLTKTEICPQSFVSCPVRNFIKGRSAVFQPLPAVSKTNNHGENKSRILATFLSKGAKRKTRKGGRSNRMIKSRINIVRYLVNVTHFGDLLQTGFCSLREREVKTEGPGLRVTTIYFLV